MRKHESTVGKTQNSDPIEVADNKFFDAIKGKKAADVQLMLEAGQEVNVADESGETAVQKACAYDETEVLKLLLEKRPNVGYSDKRGDLPITIALRGGHEEVIKLLLLTGEVDLDYVNKEGVKPSKNNLLHESVWVNQHMAVKMLIGTGAFKERMDDTNSFGQTALIMASFRGDPEMTQILVAAGANPLVKEKTTKWISRNAAETAKQFGSEATANYLKELTVAMQAIKFGTRMKMKRKAAKEAKEKAAQEAVATGS